MLSEIKLVIDKTSCTEFWNNLRAKTRREKAVINGLIMAILLKEHTVIVKHYSHSQYAFVSVQSRSTFVKYATSHCMLDSSNIEDYTIIDENEITIMIHVKVIFILQNLFQVCNEKLLVSTERKF